MPYRKKSRKKIKKALRGFKNGKKNIAAGSGIIRINYKAIPVKGLSGGLLRAVAGLNFKANKVLTD